jgi:hypothetical protein
MSIYGQVVIQGVAMPYRTVHTVWLFVAFVGFCMIEMCDKYRIVKLYITPSYYTLREQGRKASLFLILAKK